MQATVIITIKLIYQKQLWISVSSEKTWIGIEFTFFDMHDINAVYSAGISAYSVMKLNMWYWVKSHNNFNTYHVIQLVKQI